MRGKRAEDSLPTGAPDDPRLDGFQRFALKLCRPTGIIIAVTSLLSGWRRRLPLTLTYLVEARGSTQPVAGGDLLERQLNCLKRGERLIRNRINTVQQVHQI
ncbi:hypothetical protein CO671_16815 [Rhizobium sp. M10]|nr:hypothetical protein CO671_16815 [Rhizobium sp. M10]